MVQHQSQPQKICCWVPSGKQLKSIVYEHGIEANPEKILVVMKMGLINNLKEAQKHTGCMAVLSHFISRLGERGMPTYKLPKKLEQAHDQLKTFLTTPTMMVSLKGS